MLRLSLALLVCSAATVHAANDGKTVTHFLQTYCNDCHGAEKQKGDRRFDQLVLPVVKTDTLIELKDILDQINLGEMPPKKSKQPSSDEQQAFIEQITQELTNGRQAFASTGGAGPRRRLAAQAGAGAAAGQRPAQPLSARSGDAANARTW